MRSDARASTRIGCIWGNTKGTIKTVGYDKSMNQRVLVTGASGNVGREVLATLKARGIPVRAADRNADRRGPNGDGEVVRLDFRDPKSFTSALVGCRSVFLLRPPAIADTKTTLVPFIDEARRLGVEQIVFLSVAGADKYPFVPHYAVEAHLSRCGGAYTVLRPGFFAQNFGDAYHRDIAENSRIYVPAGAGRVAFVDTRDIAEVAALALTEPVHHAGAAYTLTGPEAVTFDDAAAMLGAALRRPIKYDPASLVGYARHLHRRGLPVAQIAVQSILHFGLRFGQAEAVDPTLQQLLGRRGRTLRDYVNDHASLWVAPQKSADRSTPPSAP